MMAPRTEIDEIWEILGRTETTPVKDTTRHKVTVDDYYLVVGFEVNIPAAYKDNTQDLAIDYGHAFFYVVKDRIIVSVFSFGPSGPGKIGWLDKGGDGARRNLYNSGALIKDGYKNSRPATADYHITENVRAFKIKLTREQGIKVVKNVTIARQKIDKGEMLYTAIFNDTCAEEAKDLLDEAGIETPKGSGLVKYSTIAPFSLAHGVNPYSWHNDFKKSGYAEAIKYRGASNFAPIVGKEDSIFGEDFK